LNSSAAFVANDKHFQPGKKPYLSQIQSKIQEIRNSGFKFMKELIAEKNVSAIAKKRNLHYF